MYAVEILLLCVVGFSVLVFLIIDNLNCVEKGRTTHDSEIKTRIPSVDQENSNEEIGVSADGERENSSREVNCVEKGRRTHDSEIKTRISSVDQEISNEKIGLNADDEREDDDDDWLRIDWVEVDKIFDEAVDFVTKGCRIDEDVKKELSALQIALQDQSNYWNDSVGKMSGEMIKQKYIDLISEVYPDWKSASSTLH